MRHFSFVQYDSKYKYFPLFINRYSTLHTNASENSVILPHFCFALLCHDCCFIYSRYGSTFSKIVFHHRGCYCSAIIDSLRIIDDAGPEGSAGSSARAKPRKEEHLVWHFWAMSESSCFPADPISFHLPVFPPPSFHYHFQGIAHFLDVCPEKNFLFLI